MEKNHDVYDAFILSLARAHGARYIVTTDRDFAGLCEGERVEYQNPIPEEKLDMLSDVDG